jgi:hypothetical protein
VRNNLRVRGILGMGAGLSAVKQILSLAWSGKKVSKAFPAELPKQILRIVFFSSFCDSMAENVTPPPMLQNMSGTAIQALYFTDTCSRNVPNGVILIQHFIGAELMTLMRIELNARLLQRDERY